MGTIPQELIKFRDSLQGKDITMKQEVTDIKSKLTSLNDSTKKAKSEVDNNYDSENKSSLLGSIENVNTNSESISSSLSELSSILDGVSEVIELVNQLETINREIEQLEGEISAEESKNEEERNNSLISELRAKLEEKNVQFEQTKDLAIEKLSDLRSREISINIVAAVAATIKALPENLKFGDFKKCSFVASNGISIDYMLYVPDYGEEVDGLPINMYMHGSGNGKNNFSRLTTSGLGKEISDGNVMPSGIVVLPLAPTGRTYDNKKFRDALAELPIQVAKEYNADPKKISLSGHSWGAITAYRLVNEHPDEFSAILTASGSYEVTSSFKNTKVWAFHGSKDNRNGSNTAYSKAAKAVEDINELGGDAEMHTYEGEGHSGVVLTDTFTKKFEKDGEIINPLEWAFEQVKA